jgi:hypothetical protein
MKSSELGPFAPGSGSGVAARCAGSGAAGGATDVVVSAAEAEEVGIAAVGEDDAVGEGLACALAGGFAGVRVQATIEMTKGIRPRSSLIP